MSDTTIPISTEMKDTLWRMKETSDETYEDVIERLMDEHPQRA